MTLPIQTQAEILDGLIASLSASVGTPVTLTPGDTVLGVFDAFKVQVDRLQAISQQIVAIARLQTCSGSDVDTFLAQFPAFGGRFSAMAPTGAETFSKSSPASSVILIPVGTLVQNQSGSIQYAVVEDTNQASWDAAAGAYVIQVGQTSATTTIQGVLGASTSGSALRVTSGILSSLASQIPIDSVTNPNAITNGSDQETDAAVKARFSAWISTIGKANLASILSALNQIQAGLEIEPLENINAVGAPQNGCFTMVINDGSNSPPASLIAKAQAVLEATRGFTIQAHAIAPIQVLLEIALNVRLAAGATAATVLSAVAQAVAAYVNSVGDAGTVYASEITTAAQGADGVTSVQPGSVTINGSTADFPVSVLQVAETQVANVTVGTY